MVAEGNFKREVLKSQTRRLVCHVAETGLPVINIAKCPEEQQQPVVSVFGLCSRLQVKWIRVMNIPVLSNSYPGN